MLKHGRHQMELDWHGTYKLTFIFRDFFKDEHKQSQKILKLHFQPLLSFDTYFNGVFFFFFSHQMTPF